MKMLKHEFGDDIARVMSDEVSLDISVIPTGIPSIDKAIGVGGVPKGRFTEIIGMEGSGKTTLALHIVKEAQKLNIPCFYIDAENALVPERMKQIGVDLSKVAIIQPTSGEQALESAVAISNAGEALIIIDSVAMLTPQVEIDKAVGESVMGVQARLIRQGIRKLTSPMAKNNTTMVLINQITQKIGTYGGGETTPGGSAVRFASSLRIKMKLDGVIKDLGGNRIGNNFLLTCIKNKLNVPFKMARFEISNEGIDDSTNLVEQLLESGKLTKKGSWIFFGELQISQGMRGAATKIKEDEELRKKLCND
jgi:recombination protein RecA